MKAGPIIKYVLAPTLIAASAAGTYLFTSRSTDTTTDKSAPKVKAAVDFQPDMPSSTKKSAELDDSGSFQIDQSYLDPKNSKAKVTVKPDSKVKVFKIED